MVETISYAQTALPFDPQPGAGLGTIDIRVTVLPPKKKAAGSEAVAEMPLDVEAGEQLVMDKSMTPLGSYLEASKGGKKCCVFVVNGQRQDALDNSFIIEELGFKYLRNRMMIAVDVDGLTTAALSKLMQGSRQGFYRGDIWAAIHKRLVAILKNDPALNLLEEEAEQELANLNSGDHKVKEALDQLITSHHEHGDHLDLGAELHGDGGGDQNGHSSAKPEGVVVLLRPDKGAAADYPILKSSPNASSVRLKPTEEKKIFLSSTPEGYWAAVKSVDIAPDPAVPELDVKLERLPTGAYVRLSFKEKSSGDVDYPVRATLVATATFNGVKEPRQLELSVVVKPDEPVLPPVLLDDPTKLLVSSRAPIHISHGAADTHVRMKWDGKDSLVSGSMPKWKLSARIVEGAGALKHTFSAPDCGRFSLLISPDLRWQPGDQLRVEVSAHGPEGKTLTATFTAIVVADKDDPPTREPRLVQSVVPFGSARRPPYELMYIERENYHTECWGGAPWTDDDVGCYREPTNKSPLRLLINKDATIVSDYAKSLVKRKLSEGDVDRRITKYNSHVAYHLYQMYQASVGAKEDLDAAELRRRLEIQRVGTTLVKLMEVSR